MKHTIITIFFFFYLIACYSQATYRLKNNALSFELGKTGLIYNFNFDHKFRDKNFGVRVDIGSNFYKYLSLFTTGVGGYYLTGKSINFLEVGIDINYLNVEQVSNDQRGGALVYPNYPIKTYYASANIGYRKYGKKNLFRIGFSPGVIKNNFLPGGYISFGLTF